MRGRELVERLAVLDGLMSVLRYIAADLGLPRAIRVIDRPPDGLEPPGAPEGVPLSA